MKDNKQRVNISQSFANSNDSFDSKNLLYLRTDSPFGISWEEWTMRWWKWVLSVPKKNNPGFDPTGEKFRISDQRENRNVIFLVGTFGGLAERKYIIPKGKAILVPIINFAFCSIDEPSDLGERELQIRAQNDINDLVEKYASIDGSTIKEVEKYRVTTRAFDVVYPKDNVFGIRDGSTRAVSDGYWLFLKPLEKSHHVLQVIGSCSSGKTNVNVTFHLKII